MSRRDPRRVKFVSLLFRNSTQAVKSASEASLSNMEKVDKTNLIAVQKLNLETPTELAS